MNSNITAATRRARRCVAPLHLHCRPSATRNTRRGCRQAPQKPLSRKDARELKANADARLCLEFPTTLMIVKCAEKYRPDKHES
jgi:hypothetical protein